MKNKNTYNKNDSFLSYKKLKNSKGFTLIELMITVAIVGILAAVALPAYQDYVARSQVSEGLTLVSGAKPVIAEYYSNHGSYPTSSDIGFNGYTGSYVGTTTIGADGAIVATFSDDAHSQLRGQTVTLTPEEVEETGNLRWNCSSSIDSKFLPTSCSNDGNTGNPGNGGTNPGGGETDPGETEPPKFDPTQIFEYDNRFFKYNGDGTLTQMYGPTYTGIRDENGIYFQNESGTILFRIDNNSNFSTYVSKPKYDIKQTFLPNDDGVVIEEYSGTIDGVDFNIDNVKHYASNLPSYISDNIEIYNNYKNATENVYVSLITGAISNANQMNAALNNYNIAKENYINFLNQQKNNGTITRTDQFFLDKNS